MKCKGERERNENNYMHSCTNKENQKKPIIPKLIIQHPTLAKSPTQKRETRQKLKQIKLQETHMFLTSLLLIGIQLIK